MEKVLVVHLEHDTVAVIDELSNGVAGSRHGHRPLLRVGQHLGGHDDRCTGNFANFLNR
jgi:hypothetical protein